MTLYIVPAIFLGVLVLSLLRRKDAYAAFVRGAGAALELMAGVLPFLVAVMVACELFRTSGSAAAFSRIVAPVISPTGIPPELTELLLLRPLSGAGSLSVLENIYSSFGTDTFVGRCASVVYGSSETVFYVSAIYFSGSEIKRLRYAIPLALVASFIGNIVGCNLLRLM